MSSTQNGSKYLVHDRLGSCIIWLIDLFLKNPFRRRPPLPSSFHKILLCNIAHMGDLVLSTAVLSQIKRQFPESEIGVLIASWSLPVVKGFPFITQFHLVDHWKLNRSEGSLFKKIRAYLKDRKRVIREMRAQKYDVAIDLYPFFPNAIPLLWQAKIPTRIGFTSGGFGPLLTHSVDWVEKGQGVIDQQLELLKWINAYPKERRGIAPVLPDPLLQRIPREKRYCLFHMGAGVPVKEWSEKKWRELLDFFTKEGYDVVFTGKGERQKAAIQRVIVGHVRAHDLSDCLDWDEFVSLIRHAHLLISVDSVSGHVASAFEVPTVSLFTGIDRLSQWKPENPRCEAMMKRVSCAPCFRKRGCRSMDCIQGIESKEVIETALKLLGQS